MNNNSTYCTQFIARGLSPVSRNIFNKVLAALEDAEKYDYSEYRDYLGLMQAIIDEASFRFHACQRNFAAPDD